MKTQTSFFRQLRSYNSAFWSLNVIQLIEKLSYWLSTITMPIYIAQKDLEGGLHWEQTDKGLIFFFWALVQNLSPVFTGTFADKYGKKKILFIATIIIMISYYLVATQTEFLPFLLATLLLGFGNGLFKPALQASLANNMNEENSSLGWGMNVVFINAGILFLGGWASGYFKSFGWAEVFLGCGAMFIPILLILAFYRDNNKTYHKDIDSFALIKKSLMGLKNKKLLSFILLMSGFTMLYMQFYETLPNFIYDWVDSQDLLKFSGLSESWHMKTNRGTMMDIVFFYAFSSGLIVFFVALLSYIFRNVSKTKALLTGTIIVTLGLFFSGSSMSAEILLLGITIYTIGEMITNPRFNEFMASIAPEAEKTQYMSYLNISWAIGLGGGSLLGGYFYKHLGEKATLAAVYLKEELNYTETISASEAFSKVCELSNLNAVAGTEMLWNHYNPWMTWVPFLIIGLIASIGLYIFSKRG